jgi:hypothetical protein
LIKNINKRFVYRRVNKNKRIKVRQRKKRDYTTKYLWQERNNKINGSSKKIEEKQIIILLAISLFIEALPSAVDRSTKKDPSSPHERELQPQEKEETRIIKK